MRHLTIELHRYPIHDEQGLQLPSALARVPAPPTRDTRIGARRPSETSGCSVSNEVKTPLLDPGCPPSECIGHYYSTQTQQCRESCGGGTIFFHIFSPSAPYERGYRFIGADACFGCGPCAEITCYHAQDEQ